MLSTSSGSSQPSCALCQEVLTRQISDPILTALGLPKVSRLIAEDELSICVPSLGPIARGHVLIVTKNHFDNLRETPGGIANRLVSRSRSVMKKLAALLGCQVIAFENGDAVGTPQPNCVRHTHIHLAPIPVATDFNYVLSRIPMTPTRYDGDSDSFARVSADVDYVALFGANTPIFIACAPAIPPQLMRRVLFDIWNRAPEWNWRDCPRLQAVLDDASFLEPLNLYSE